MLMCVHDEGELSDSDVAGLRLMQVRTVQLDSSSVQPISRQVTKPLPPDCPSWATYLNECEVTAFSVLCNSLCCMCVLNLFWCSDARMYCTRAVSMRYVRQ